MTKRIDEVVVDEVYIVCTVILDLCAFILHSRKASLWDMREIVEERRPYVSRELYEWGLDAIASAEDEARFPIYALGDLCVILSTKEIVSMTGALHWGDIVSVNRRGRTVTKHILGWVTKRVRCDASRTLYADVDDEDFEQVVQPHDLKLLVGRHDHAWVLGVEAAKWRAIVKKQILDQQVRYPRTRIWQQILFAFSHSDERHQN